MSPMQNWMDVIGPSKSRPLSNSLNPLQTYIRRANDKNALCSDFVSETNCDRSFSKTRLVAHQRVSSSKGIVEVGPLKVPEFLVGRAGVVTFTDFFERRFDFIMDACRDVGIHFDVEGFERAMQQQRERKDRRDKLGKAKRAKGDAPKMLMDAREDRAEALRLGLEAWRAGVVHPLVLMLAKYTI